MGLIAGVAIMVVVAAVAALADTEESSAVQDIDSDEDASDGTEPVERLRWWTNHDGGYYTCSHTGCKKKVTPSIPTHDCCGRCWPGKECLKTAQRDYAGPGSFYHKYFEAILFPGVCTVCDEPPEAH